MIRKIFLIFVSLGLATGFGLAQSIVKTSDLFSRSADDSRAGQLNIIQSSSIVTLVSRYILVNKNLKEEYNHYGMQGFRIQIYRSSNRNARDESNIARAEFMSLFPDIISYLLYDDPGYFIVKVGDFRTRTEATKLFLIISKSFPDAYIVPDFINFPELKTK
ncbi:MAG: hypothetical protein Q7J06_09310 [Bacteroidales bacterium]|nr:hypothetical protein [Bacteroidales bacterium]